MTDTQTNTTVEPDAPNFVPDSQYLLENPLGTTRHIRIITIGAGASGLNMIRALRKHLDNYEHVVYEKNPDVGGTWYENRYPGCKCDVPSHNYQFTWRHNPEWSGFYVGAPEIQQYFRKLADEEKMWDSIRLSHQVVRAEWNEDEGMWCVNVKNLQTEEIFEDKCHFLLDASGVLNKWKWPDIEGLHTFKGGLVHSANWPEELNYANKRVAVIGNGSSGVQIVTEIQPVVKQLVHSLRSANWVVPSMRETILAQIQDEDLLEKLAIKQNDFTPEQIHLFKENPELYLRLIKAADRVFNDKYKVLISSSKEASEMKQKLKIFMAELLEGDEHLSDVLIPDFPVGCRRLVPSLGYLEALHKENVKVITEGIAKIVPEGLITTSGEMIPVDIIVCATGFDTSFRPKYPVIGRYDDLRERWAKQDAHAYFSFAVPGMPNYWMFLGPNAPAGHGSILNITEHIAKLMVKILRKCQTQNIKALAPKEEVVKEYVEHVDAFMPRTAWAGNCRSWFKNGRSSGSVTVLHPGSRIHFFHTLDEFRGEDFDLTLWTKNRFQYLGNGSSTRELNGNDPTYYWDYPDQLHYE
ncbi:uncharacterized protein Z520_02408 [Fonsecaea multimorphosa CBS 102226]|uniref:FAD/NAD(P)-binding domain-containing protein n=1 Tax=Fonsecaea multimorphosa CBS 102226 TaxID=1442371 RepID=A0A0D2KFK5_9EURO|nr:uncharacterized protein Z520_02408 [Fonsecaea multimorphosa CBS 102226]KIY02270.1 hypothetical protein Z520_02408 [Fonsecaea multimorphosa CBS 102226]